MKKSILEIYALAVCFVTLIIFTITLGIGLYNIVETINPELTMDAWEWNKYQSNDAFFEQMPYYFENDGNLKARNTYEENEITEKRRKSFEIALMTERREALQSLIRVFFILAINIVVFIPHWKLAKKNRESRI